MKISILGSGPIPNKLATELRGNSLVELFTSQEITIDGIEVFKYETFTSRMVNSDVVILAWRGLPSPGSEKAEVLKYLVQNVSSNSTIINLSSVAVYGQNPGINYETTVPKPINPYGQSKLDLEIYLDNFAASKVCNLRISNVFGDSKFNDIVNKMLKSQLNKTSLELLEPDRLFRDYISIDSLIGALKALTKITSTLEARNLLNISSGLSISVQELKFFVEKCLNSPIKFVTGELTQEIIVHSAISNSRASAFLQIEFNRNLDELKSYVLKNSTPAQP